jgi:hypothetical protein
MFDDLVTRRPAPPNRASACEGGIEHHLYEGAVMIAFAMHLLARSTRCCTGCYLSSFQSSDFRLR